MQIQKKVFALGYIFEILPIQTSSFSQFKGTFFENVKATLELQSFDWDYFPSTAVTAVHWGEQLVFMLFSCGLIYRSHCVRTCGSVVWSVSTVQAALEAEIRRCRAGNLDGGNKSGLGRATGGVNPGEAGGDTRAFWVISKQKKKLGKWDNFKDLLGWTSLSRWAELGQRVSDGVFYSCFLSRSCDIFLFSARKARSLFMQIHFYFYFFACESADSEKREHEREWI